MLRRRVIPCLDVADGRVVKGTRFVDLVDEGDPPELAERYAREGADELVFLDISAAPERRGTLLDIVERTARRAFIPLTVGGGVRSSDEMRDVLRAGADKVSLNTAAVADPALIGRCAARFGSQAVVVAIDARRRLGPRRDPAWEVVVKGGREATRPGRGGLGRARRRAGRRRAAGHLHRSRRDRRGLRHGPAARDHGARVRAGHRLRRRGRARRLRRRGARWRCRRRARRVDLPSPHPLDRVGQGGDGGGRIAGAPSCRRSRHERGGCGRRGHRGSATPEHASDRRSTPAPAPEVRFGTDGLVPAIVQDAADGRVLMLAWMDAEALDRHGRDG